MGCQGSSPIHRHDSKPGVNQSFPLITVQFQALHVPKVLHNEGKQHVSKIQQHGEQAALHTANRMIRETRKAHDKLPVGHEARMAKRQSTVTRTAQLWHNHRSVMLNTKPSHATQWPVRRNRRRPPRKPPDSPPG
ncbi:unnamed protein product [Aphanomyces euteiches]|nr:hypothetical protein AeRB84_021165 [Aphanomyces euteiches]